MIFDGIVIPMMMIFSIVLLILLLYDILMILFRDVVVVDVIGIVYCVIFIVDDIRVDDEVFIVW
jgi:hypothetical protein